MNESDLLISRRDDSYSVKVSGRANFDYAVPLRELGKSLDVEFKELYFDLSDCVTMDSTFMGVMSMLGLKAYKAKSKMVLSGASAQVRHLLKALGIDRLFEFVDGAPAPGNDWSSLKQRGDGARDMLKTAETVVEAHETLAAADEANQQRFKSVIELAKEDLEQLKKQQGPDESK